MNEPTTMRVRSSGMQEGTTAPPSGGPEPVAATLWERIRALFPQVNIRRQPRRLRLCETLSLGEKRILALVECDNRRFLVAATAQSICVHETLGIPPTEDAPCHP